MSDLRLEFHGELDDLRNEVARLGAYVVELIPRVTDILLQQDLEGAEYVLRNDAEIDARSTAVEEKAITLLALQAPVARDLRQVASVLKLAPEIERSADLCCNICKAARRIYGHDLDPKLRGTIAKMGEQAQQLYSEAIDAYVELDAAKAGAIDDMDSYLDGLQKQFLLCKTTTLGNYGLRFQEAATSLIDPSGRCQAHLPYGQPGVLVESIDLAKATGHLAARFAPERY